MPEMISIEAVTAGMVEAWNNHDMQAFGNVYAESADFVNIFGDWLKGRGQIVTEHAARHQSMFRAARLTIHSTDMRSIRPDIAIVRSRWQMDGLQDPAGKAVPSRTGLLMHVMERGDDGWRIVATQNTEIVRH